MISVTFRPPEQAGDSQRSGRDGLQNGERGEGRISSLLEGARAPSTIRAYKSALRPFREWQNSGPEERKRDELTSAAVFIARRSIGSKATSLATTFISALAYERFGSKPEEALKWAILDEMVKAQRRSNANSKQVFASAQEFRTLLACLPQICWPQWRKDRTHVLLILMFYGLLRASEAVALKVEDVEATDQFCTVRIRVGEISL